MAMIMAVGLLIVVSTQTISSQLSLSGFNFIICYDSGMTALSSLLSGSVHGESKFPLCQWPRCLRRVAARVDVSSFRKVV